MPLLGMRNNKHESRLEAVHIQNHENKSDDEIKSDK